MRILTASETKALDSYTIKHEPIASIDLMERASERFTTALLRRFPNCSEFHILVGMGNNGGDGLAVARLLANKGMMVLVSVLKHSEKGSVDFQINLDRLNQSRNVEITEVSELQQLRRSDQALVVDGILGSGLTRPVSGFLKVVVVEVNSWPNIKVSIDIPTGLFANDNSENDRSAILQADHCTTFHGPKLSFLLPDNGAFVPSFEVIDIGLSLAGVTQVSRSFDHYLTARDIAHLLPNRQKYSHKGKFGHALLVAGSKGMAGASILAGRACLKTGAGLLSIQVPRINLHPVQSALPEAMCFEDKLDDVISELPDPSSFTAIGIGPGIGRAKETEIMLREFLGNCKRPMVLDADALNIISADKKLQTRIPKNSVLTPHPKEFDRLFGKSETGFDRLKIQREKAAELGVIIVLKGAHSSIALPNGEVWFNSTGNPGMATAGSGDVLTGMILGLLAQGIEPSDAAKLGVFLHGAAGDLAAEKVGEASLIASDLINELPNAIRQLRASEQSS